MKKSNVYLSVAAVVLLVVSGCSDNGDSGSVAGSSKPSFATKSADLNTSVVQEAFNLIDVADNINTKAPAYKRNTSSRRAASLVAVAPGLSCDNPGTDTEPYDCISGTSIETITYTVEDNVCTYTDRYDDKQCVEDNTPNINTYDGIDIIIEKYVHNASNEWEKFEKVYQPEAYYSSENSDENTKEIEKAYSFVETTQYFDFNETAEGAFDSKLDITGYKASGKIVTVKMQGSTVVSTEIIRADFMKKTDNSKSDKTVVSMDGWIEIIDDDYDSGIAAEKYTFTTKRWSEVSENHESVTVSGKLGSSCIDGLVTFTTEEIALLNADADEDVLPYDGNMTVSGANSAEASVIFDGLFANTDSGNTATVTMKGAQSGQTFHSFIELTNSGLCIQVAP